MISFAPTVRFPEAGTGTGEIPPIESGVVTLGVDAATPRRSGNGERGFGHGGRVRVAEAVGLEEVLRGPPSPVGAAAM